MKKERIKNYKKTSEILKVLGHPIRLQMVDGLINNECNVNNIAESMNLPQSTVSQHLGILRSRGIVSAKKEGVKTCYRINDRKVVKIVEIFRE